MPKVITLAENEPLSEADMELLSGGDNEPTLTDKLEEAVYKAQEALIAIEYGRKAADHANYGWAVDDTGVATKVYLPNGTMILCTEVDAKGVMAHEWEPY